MPSPNLLPEQDGLPMRPAGRWAILKLDYLMRYIDVFETSMRQKWPDRYYVDLFCGPGKDQLRGSTNVMLGSPLLALAAKHPFSRYFFADMEPKYTEALAQRCAASRLLHRVDIRTGDCNILVGGIVKELKHNESSALSLAFLDPPGLQLNWTTVAQLASLPRMDLIIYYPRYGMSRNLPQACASNSETAFDRFFGAREWREIYQRWARKELSFNIHRHLKDYYKERLQTLGYVLPGADEPPQPEPLMRNSANAPLYNLIFASKHKLGLDLWAKITGRDASGQRRFL